MAEFCVDCWNKINETNTSEKRYILSEDLNLCEECGEWKHTIIIAKSACYRYRFRWIIFSFVPIYYIILFMWCVLCLFRHLRKNKDDIDM